MSDNRTDLPSPSAPNFNQRLRETIQTYLGRQGNPLDRGLTLRDLIENGIVKLRDGFTLKPGSGSGTLPLEPGHGIVDEPDLTPPPTPTGLTATAAISHIIIEHDAPIYTQGRGHLRTRLYGKIVNTGDPLPTFSDAVEIAQFDGTVYAHPSNPATTWRFWIKWETIDNVLSIDPAGGTNGVEAITGQDVTRLVKAMTGDGNPFKIVTEQLTLDDGSVVPPGTYTSDAYIHSGQIANAMIANLAVDDAKIANVSVDKLTAGSVSVGDFIQSTGYVAGSSGWRINGDGNAELSNATVRGTVYANDGNFKGSIYGGTVDDYANGVGLFAGTSSGTYKFHVGDPSANRVAWDGANISIVSPKLTIANGSAVFSGELNAATGSFSGRLNAATGTFSGELMAGVIDPTKLLGETHIINSGPGIYTFTVPSDKTSVKVELLGGGGGGGGGSVRSAYGPWAAGGGGAGGLATINFVAKAGDTLTITIGAGGIGGSGSDGPYSKPNNGSDGGASIAKLNGTQMLIANGGRGGGGAGGSTRYGDGGAGGTPGGASGVSGSDASYSYDGESGTVTVIKGSAGSGAGTAYGSGGAAGIYGGDWQAVPGGNGSGFGSGGGGGPQNSLWGLSDPNAGVRFKGGNGSPGVAEIQFYNPNGVVLRQELVDKGIL